MPDLPTPQADSQSGTPSFEAILNSIDDPIFVKDEHHRWIYLNDKWCQLAGRRREDLLLKTDYDIFPKEEADIFWEMDQKVLDSNIPNTNIETAQINSQNIIIETKKSPLEDPISHKKYIIGISHDITSVYKTITQLQESEERFRAFAEQSAIGIMIVQEETLVFMNQYLIDLLELPEIEFEEWKMAQLNEFIHPDDLQDIKTNYTEPFPNRELRIITKSGRTIWIEQYSRDIHYHEKTAQQIVVVNITPRKEIEEILRKSEIRYRTLFEKSPIGILTADTSGKILTINDKMVSILGSPSAEATKQINLLTFPLLKPIRFPQNLQKCITQKIDINEEVTYTSKWGKTSYLQYKMVPLINNEGNVYEILVNVNDITHIKEAQDTVVQKELQFQEFVRFAPIPIAILSPNQEIIFLNQKFRTSFNIDDDSNHNIFSLIQTWNLKLNQIENSRSFFDRYWEKMLKNLKNGEIVEEFDLISGAGEPQEWSITIKLIDNQIFAMFENISERKKIEQEKLRMQKLESLSLLAGGIAHDFNNILVGILGNISLLQYEDNLSSEISQTISELEKATLRAKGLTNQLLTFSKGGQPVKEPSQIEDIMKESITLVSRGIKSQCVFSSEENIPLINIDPTQIQQVFNNIIINAIQSMPNGGIISIQISNVSTPQHKEIPSNEEGYILISISDQGGGIDLEIQKHIFEPYNTNKEQGSGLGLATSYSIIRNHNGFLIFDSILGKGTTFYIYLPNSPSKLHTVRKITNTPQDVPVSKKILLMDDDKIVGQTLQKMLHKLGYSSDLTQTGEKAIDLYFHAISIKEPYDLMIVDLTVPGGLGGKEIIELIRKRDPNVKALVSSGYSQDPILAKFQDYGFIGILLKPYTIGELKMRLQQIFSPT